MRLDLMPHLAALEIPKADEAGRVPGHQELPVWTDRNIDGVPRRVVAAEALLAVLAEAIRGRVHDDLVVRRLERNGFAVRVRRGAHEREQMGLGDVLDRDGDVVFPSTEGSIVRGGDEAAVFVAEGNGVDRLQMMIVLLRHFAGAAVELDDFLVGSADEEFVRVGGRVEAEDVGHGFGGGLEARDAGACFGVPELHVAVVGAGEELGAGGGEGGVGHRFGVAGVSAEE